MRTSLVLLSLLFLAGCRSTPSVLPDAPLPPRPQIDQKAPRPPSPPRKPASTGAIELPVPPKGRMQTIHEVYVDQHWDDAVPQKFPFGPEHLVVVAMPPNTNDSDRLAMIGAFLAAGFRVKDAGTFGQANFLIDNHPWWYSAGEAFLRKVSDGEVPVPEKGDEKDAKRDERTYRGFGGMKLSLQDPTSLWAPDLLSNQNLQSDYFVRLFSLRFYDAEVTVERRQVFEDSAVVAFRGEAEKVNSRIRSYNAEVDAFNRAKKRYEEEYAVYQSAYEDWRMAQVRRYERNHADYVTSFEQWKTANAKAIAAARAEGTLPAGTPSRAERKLRNVVATEMEPAASLRSMQRVKTFGTEDLDKAMSAVVKDEVPSVRLELMYEIIDSKTGEVVQAVRATGVGRRNLGESRLLREVIKRLTKRR